MVMLLEVTNFAIMIQKKEDFKISKSKRFSFLKLLQLISGNNKQ